MATLAAVMTALAAITTTSMTSNLGLSNALPEEFPVLALEYNGLDVPQEYSPQANVVNTALRVSVLVDMYILAGAAEIETRSALIALFDELMSELADNAKPGSIQYPIAIFSTHIGSVIYLGNAYSGVKVTLWIRYDTA